MRQRRNVASSSSRASKMMHERMSSLSKNIWTTSTTPASWKVWKGGRARQHSQRWWASTVNTRWWHQRWRNQTHSAENETSVSVSTRRNVWMVRKYHIVIVQCVSSSSSRVDWNVSRKRPETRLNDMWNSMIWRVMLILKQWAAKRSMTCFWVMGIIVAVIWWGCWIFSEANVITIRWKRRWMKCSGVSASSIAVIQQRRMDVFICVW